MVTADRNDSIVSQFSTPSRERYLLRHKDGDGLRDHFQKQIIRASSQIPCRSATISKAADKAWSSSILRHCSFRVWYKIHHGFATVGLSVLITVVAWKHATKGSEATKPDDDPWSQWVESPFTKVRFLWHDKQTLKQFGQRLMFQWSMTFCETKSYPTMCQRGRQDWAVDTYLIFSIRNWILHRHFLEFFLALVILFRFGELLAVMVWSGLDICCATTFYHGYWKILNSSEPDRWTLEGFLRFLSRDSDTTESPTSLDRFSTWTKFTIEIFDRILKHLSQYPSLCHSSKLVQSLRFSIHLNLKSSDLASDLG
jgi:hypothetical protein